MIKKVMQKKNFKKFSEVKENLAYWLSKAPEERVAAVEHLRRQHHGSSARLQRTVHIVQRSLNKRALGRKKDQADLEALGEE